MLKAHWVVIVNGSQQWMDVCVHTCVCTQQRVWSADGIPMGIYSGLVGIPDTGMYVYVTCTHTYMSIGKRQTS